MIYITISAMTLEEAEIMLKVLDKYLRRYFNTYGVKRGNSWTRRANDGYRAQIVGQVSREQWEMVHTWAMCEMAEKLLKTVKYEIVFNTCIDLTTAEAEL